MPAPTMATSEAARRRALREVHRAADATEAADGAPGDLAEDPVERHRRGPTRGRGRGRCTTRGRSVARRWRCRPTPPPALTRVRRAVDQTLGEQLLDAVLEAADLEHPVPAGDRLGERRPPLQWGGGRPHDAYPSRSHHGRGRRPVARSLVTAGRTSATDTRYRCSRWAGNGTGTSGLVKRTIGALRAWKHSADHVGGDVGAPPAGVRALLDDHESSRAFHRLAHTRAVPRHQRAQVDHLGAPRGAARPRPAPPDRLAEGHDRDVVAAPSTEAWPRRDPAATSTSSRSPYSTRGSSSTTGSGSSIAARSQAVGAVASDATATLRPGVAYIQSRGSASAGCRTRARHPSSPARPAGRCTPAGQVADLRRLGHHLVEGDAEELDEHDLDDRTEPGGGGSDGGAAEPHLGDRRVPDVPRPNLSSRPSVALNGPSATATSSPIRITVGSAAMASSRARAIDWRMRSFTPETLPKLEWAPEMPAAPSPSGHSPSHLDIWSPTFSTSRSGDQIAQRYGAGKAGGSSAIVTQPGRAATMRSIELAVMFCEPTWAPKPGRTWIDWNARRRARGGCRRCVRARARAGRRGRRSGR